MRWPEEQRILKPKANADGVGSSTPTTGWFRMAWGLHGAVPIPGRIHRPVSLAPVPLMPPLLLSSWQPYPHPRQLGPATVWENHRA